MYNSLKDWMSVATKLKRFKGRDGMGEVTYHQPETLMAYVQDEVKQVVDTSGKEVISQTQVYLDGTVPIDVRDLICIEGPYRIIQSISTFYDGKGNKDIMVVYLQ